MGGTESKGAESPYLAVFSQNEKLRIRQKYSGIIGNQKDLTEPFLKKYLPSWFPPDISAVIFHAVCQCEANKHGSHGNKHITEEQFGSFLAEAIRGTYTEKADLLFLFSEIGNAKQSEIGVTTVRLYQIVSSVIKSYTTISRSDPPCQTWKCHCSDSDVARMSASLLGIADLDDVSTSEMKTREDIDSWISECPLFSMMFDRVFNELFDIRSEDDISSASVHSVMPFVTNVNWAKTDTILDTLSISYINYHLPRRLQSTWRLLFSNRLYGDSFSQLLTFISKQGPNVLIVRDKDNSVFGAFLSESWELKPQFYDTLVEHSWLQKVAFDFSDYVTFAAQYNITKLMYRRECTCMGGTSQNQHWNYIEKLLPALKLQHPDLVPGSPDCFIFTLSPGYNVYTATGYNQNFMYLNQGQQTLPNGLGIGGQLDYFGLWIDQSFNHGHSKAGPKCTTYGSPQLSSHPEFEVDAIEVWGVGPEKKYDDDDEVDERTEWEKTSALDKNPAAKAILEMIGKPQISEGLREIGEVEPMTEEMKRKMNTIPKMM